MRNRFDEVAKRIGTAALAPCGTTFIQDPISPETQFADRHEPDPARDAERAQLGLLGRLAARPCIIESFSRALSPDDFRACLSKHLALWQQRARAMLKPPSLWIVSAGAPQTLLATLPFERATDWPTGVYELGGDVLRVRLVIARELIRDPSTLLVRLMAGGPLLVTAISEVWALSADSPTRCIAEPVLVELRHVLELVADRQPEEEEFIMAMHKTWEEARNEARNEGRIEVLRKQLVRKFGDLTPDTEARIAAASPEDLDRFLERILFADSLAGVFV